MSVLAVRIKLAIQSTEVVVMPALAGAVFGVGGAEVIVVGIKDAASGR
jgi:hypothetical protein